MKKKKTSLHSKLLQLPNQHKPALTLIFLYIGKHPDVAVGKTDSYYWRALTRSDRDRLPGWTRVLFVWFLRARMRKCDDAPPCSFFRGSWRCVRSLTKMSIFLKMPSFTLFITDLIRDTWWLPSALRTTFSSPAFQVRSLLYGAVGKSVCGHLPFKDRGWEERREEKVSGASQGWVGESVCVCRC